MMSNSRFDETEQTWVWDYQTEDATHPMYMDIGKWYHTLNLSTQTISCYYKVKPF